MKYVIFNDKKKKINPCDTKVAKGEETPKYKAHIDGYLSLSITDIHIHRDPAFETYPRSPARAEAQTDQRAESVLPKASERMAG